MPARAADRPRAVPDFGAIVDVPGAELPPDPKLRYRIVFGVTKAATDAGQVNPSLDRVARFVDLLDRYAVPPGHREVTAIISGPATAVVRKPTAGLPVSIDAKLIGELTEAGVRIAVCSQAAHGHGIATTDLLPGVHMDVSAITTIATLQAEGYQYLPD